MAIKLNNWGLALRDNVIESLSSWEIRLILVDSCRLENFAEKCHRLVGGEEHIAQALSEALKIKRARINKELV